LTEVNLWKKSTLDGKHKARHGNVKQSVLEDLAETFIGKLPSVRDSLSTQEVAELLPLMTIETVSKIAESKNNVSVKLQERWILDEKARSRKAIKDSKVLEKEYIIQQDTLKAVKPTKISSKKKDDLRLVDTDDDMLPEVPVPPKAKKTKKAAPVPVDDIEDSPPAMNVTPSSIAKAKAGQLYEKRLGDVCE